MKVKVKDGMKGFFGGSLRHGAGADKDEGDTFTIEAKQHSTQKGEDGKPLVITEDEQFSDKWMEKTKEQLVIEAKAKAKAEAEIEAKEKAEAKAKAKAEAK